MAQGQTLDDDLLMRLCAQAAQTPGPFHLRPWRFVVVRSEVNRQQLAACAFGQTALTQAPAVVIVLGFHNPHQSQLDALFGDPTGLAAVDPSQRSRQRGQAYATIERIPDRVAWSTRWAMLAAGHLIAAAQASGLTSIAIDSFDPARLRASFGVPDDHTPCCLIALDPAPRTFTSAGPLPPADLCDLEHFGQPRPPVSSRPHPVGLAPRPSSGYP